MKNMISTKFKYFFDGFDQYVVFTTKKQCKEYLKASPNINRIKDLKEIGIEEWNKISEHPRDKVFEIIDNVAIPMEIKTIDEIPKESEIHPTPLPYEKDLEKQREDNRMECVKNCPPDNGSFCEKHFQIDCEFSRRIGERDNEVPIPYEIENCPNCADQASIAAPGQTTLCKTHEDEKHFREMKDFFDEYIQEIILKPHMSFCSRCGANSPDYILLLHTSGGSPLNFAACTNCRDELTLKQNAARAALERIGA